MNTDHTHGRVPPETPADDEGPVRNMHDVLSNWHRRAILYHLQDRDQSTGLAELAREVADWNRDVDRDPDLAGATLEQTRSVLLHRHILEMVEFGILDYDAEADAVQISTNVSVTVRPPDTRRDNPPQP